MKSSTRSSQNFASGSDLRASVVNGSHHRGTENDAIVSAVPRGTMTQHFDVLVIGGGHAGAEAARVCARGRVRVAMVPMLRDALGRMSCNPARGGRAKGNLLKEVQRPGWMLAE